VRLTVHFVITMAVTVLVGLDAQAVTAQGPCSDALPTAVCDRLQKPVPPEELVMRVPATGPHELDDVEQQTERETPPLQACNNRPIRQPGEPRDDYQAKLMKWRDSCEAEDSDAACTTSEGERNAEEQVVECMLEKTEDDEAEPQE